MSFTDTVDTIARYRKAVVALAGAVVLGVGHYFGVDSDVYAQVVALVTAAGVYGVPNAE